jgi:hypothetical protein
MPAGYRSFLASTLLTAFAPLAGALAAPPAPVETFHGITKAAHAITRGHNRKVVYDAAHARWYVFWLEETDGSPVVQPGEGITVQSSKKGKKWSAPRPVGFEEAGATSLDVIESGGGFYALGISTNVLTGLPEYGVRRLDVAKDGTLVPGPISAAFVNGAPLSDHHFYGSLLEDASGGFWIAARVGDSTPGTHAEVIRSTSAGSTAAWGASGCTGAACTNAWTNPYPSLVLEQGTIANRLFDLGGFGIGLMTYNKNNSDPGTVGRILFTLNPSGGHAGWTGAPVLLTDQANQNDGAGVDDPTRLDDRRYSAVLDRATGVIHVVYVARDTAGPENANLRYFTFSPPYASQADKSPEQVLVAGETDGVQLAIDSRVQPSKLYAFYVENAHPDYPLKMLWNDGSGWTPATSALLLSGTTGKRRYPQAPERIETDKKIVVLFQEDDGSSLWDIRSVRVKLPR